MDGGKVKVKISLLSLDLLYLTISLMAFGSKSFSNYTNSKFRQLSWLSIDQAHQPDDSGEVSYGAEVDVVDQLSLIRYNNLVISLQFFY